MKDTIEIKSWIKRGIMMVRSDALDLDDKDHPINQIVAQGEDPRQFGYPDYGKETVACPNCGHLIHGFYTDK